MCTKNKESTTKCNIFKLPVFLFENILHGTVNSFKYRFKIDLTEISLYHKLIIFVVTIQSLIVKRMTTKGSKFKLFLR